jgi:CRP-like cAMP-binding protein
VVAGLVKSTGVSAQGKAVTYTGVRSGGWFGEGSLLKGERRPYDVVALQRSTLVFMPKAQFTELWAGDIGFNHFLIDQLNERLGQFIVMLEADRLFGPETRVARTLAQLFNARLYPDTGRHLAITQEEIGLLCGMSRSRTNQALARLTSAGLLTLEYNGVSVPDPARLLDYDWIDPAS